ncbi:MAG TPA: FtsX-like permease family protein [Mycobacteriales bacterium]|nr:FtsX-like permease family protein [Mycobacteriales bacterium]
MVEPDSGHLTAGAGNAGVKGGQLVALSYMWRELRHRLGRTVVTALGLAAGVGLVMAIIGVSTGVSRAQNKVLSPLSSVGTDLIVTRTVAATTSASASSQPAASTSGSDASGFFGAGAGKGLVAEASKLDSSDQSALIQANSSVITDLAKLGPPGTKFTHDFFVQGTLITFPSQAISAVSHISGVTSAVGALSVSAVHETGTVPKIVASLTTTAQTVKTAAKPSSFTVAQLESTLACVQHSAAASKTSHLKASSDVIASCLPAQDRAYYTTVVVPAETIHQVVNPPSTDTKTTTYSVAGVDPASPTSGLVTRSQVTKGHWYDGHAADEVLVNTAYANTHKIAVGQQVKINAASYRVVGLVSPTLTGNVADLYFDLPTLQKLSSSAGRVNEVLVSVKDAGQVSAVAAAIHKALPGAQVLTSKDLADQVSGSLANAHKLADDLGAALAIVVLLAGFAIAVLLTLSNITKRVREIGSLRAMGWSRGLVVRQILAETIGIGVLGGVIGIALGAGICGLIDAVGPSLSVTSSGLSVGASAASALFGQSTSGSSTGSVALTAPIELTSVVLGFLGALIGGALAGALGGWRAARLAPATALRDLG